ncbi:S-adenosyl-L-methionine-dependent methyltransferase [Rhodocollybia butyracea]|uniref:Cytosine-specific methyltransferase n=1 Tax=Rhodocollybia butyracea TaxID=206335 RepID=A0A9P5PII2_9AGAR|nr:S-adenosyl-L-methionine-dependent methyltransferase [Rhodocollybia butyracea]
MSYEKGVEDGRKALLQELQAAGLVDLTKSPGPSSNTLKRLLAETAVPPTPSPKKRRIVKTLSHVEVPKPESVKKVSTLPHSEPLTLESTSHKTQNMRRSGSSALPVTKPKPPRTLSFTPSKLKSISRTASSTPSKRTRSPASTSSYHDTATATDVSSSEESLRREFSESQQTKTSTKVLKLTTKSTVKPTVTPGVFRAIGPFFRNEFEVVGTELLEDWGEPELPHKSHEGNPKSILWGTKLDEEDEKVYYDSVTMDGAKYTVGDVVMVEPGPDERKGRQKNYQSGASQSVNKNANIYWFIRISYIFDDLDLESKMFHGQWLEHGSKTLMQEVANSRSLYLTNECSNQPLDVIYRKIDVDFLVPGELEKPDDQDPDGERYYCQHIWNDQDTKFTDLPTAEEVAADGAFSPAHRMCHSCILQGRAEFRKTIRFIESWKTGVSHFGVDYHIHDFVYLCPVGDEVLLSIAQVMAIIPPTKHNGVPKFRVRMLNPELHSTNDRLLALGDAEELVSFDRVQGKCYVLYFRSKSAPGITNWIAERDHYYILNSKLDQCAPCLEEQKDLLRAQADLLPIPALELFAGAGGLGTGLDMSGFVETVGAVEWIPHAAETYKANHSNTAVYVEDVNELLNKIVHGKDVKPLPVGSNQKSFLKLGKIDLISGGPPCQAFSAANHSPKEDDERATYPFTMLSFVEHLQPKYVLLENVVGILRYQLLGKQAKRGRNIVGGIRHGVFKLIVRALVGLGYQVQVKVLQAANYGAPQSRERVIFWATKQGLKMPEFPVPTHAYRAKDYKILEFDDLKLNKVTRSLDPDESQSFAPFKAVTVNDAIGDLNPHRIIPATDLDIEKAKIRRRVHWPAFCAVTGECKTLPGFRDAKYAHPPMNDFQRMMRRNMPENAEVQEHVTPTYSSKIVECTTTVPFKPRACHWDIPFELHRKKPHPTHTYYGRLDPNECFTTSMTKCSPNIKFCRILHPTQKRIITVLEYARSQGFPDDYTFMRTFSVMEAKLAYKEIGNAVPIPLALALGRALGSALIANNDHDEDDRSSRAVSVDV